MRRSILFVISLLLAPLSVAHADDVPDSAVLASGQQVQVSMADVRNELSLLSKKRREQVLSDKKQLQSLVTRIYFRRRMEQIAHEQGYIDEPRLQARLRRAREEALAETVPARFLDELDMPDLSEPARTYYDENIEEFTPEERIRAAHILLHAPKAEDKERRREEAEALLQKLRDGADFGELAAEHSDDGSQYTKGDLGMFAADDMVPEFSEAAFALEEPGEISGVVETRFGFHIIKLLERPEIEPTPFEEVEEQIVAKLRKERQREALGAWLEEQVSREAAMVSETRLEEAFSSLSEAEELAEPLNEKALDGAGVPKAK